MSDIDGTSEDFEAQVEAPEIETPDSGPAEQAAQISQQQTGINPAWVPLRDAIGDDFFNAHAKPLLAQMDESANSRITSLGGQLKAFEPYKQLIDDGVSMEDIQTALTAAQLINSDPKGFVEMLNGYIDPEDAQAANLLDPEGEEGGDQTGQMELPAEIQAQLSQIAQFQQQQAEQQQQQEFEAQVAEADRQILEETNAYISATPHFTESDIPELMSIRSELTRVLQDRGMNRLATLEEAGQVLTERFKSYQGRFGNDSAPRTLAPGAGGAPTPNPVDTAKMSKSETIDLVAARLAAANGQ